MAEADVVSWTDWIPGSGIVKAVAGIGQEYIAGKRAKSKRKHELEAAELDLEREIVRQSTGWCRIFALAFLFGPDAALLLPWVTAADLASYYEALSTAQPEWRATAKEYIVLAMWGGAELTNGAHKFARGRRRDRERAQADAGRGSGGSEHANSPGAGQGRAGGGR